MLRANEPLPASMCSTQISFSTAALVDSEGCSGASCLTEKITTVHDSQPQLEILLRANENQKTLLNKLPPSRQFPCSLLKRETTITQKQKENKSKYRKQDLCLFINIIIVARVRVLHSIPRRHSRLEYPPKGRQAQQGRSLGEFVSAANQQTSITRKLRWEKSPTNVLSCAAEIGSLLRMVGLHVLVWDRSLHYSVCGYSCVCMHFYRYQSQ